MCHFHACVYRRRSFYRIFNALVCSIPNGQKQHFSVLSNLHEKHRLIEVCVCNTVISVIVAEIKNKLVWPDDRDY